MGTRSKYSAAWLYITAIILMQFATVRISGASIEEIDNSWHQKTTKTIKRDDGTTIKIEVQRFKAFPKSMVRTGFYKNEAPYTLIACAEKCEAETECASFSYETSGKRCRRHTGVYAGTLSAARYSHGEITFYEKKNPCNVVPNLCEHGSECVPDFSRKTYSCVNCLAPYDGKHCNESGPANDPNISKDILYGRNVSCRALKDNFANFAEGLNWIHPWRDARKIKVYCYLDGTMLITYISKSDPSPIRELIEEDQLEDGSNLYDGNFRAHQPFAQKLEKLIHYDFLNFKCKNMAGREYKVNIKDLSALSCHNVLFMFLGQKPYKVEKYCIKGDYRGTDALNSEWPTRDVPTDQRLFADILVLNTADSKRMTFTNSSMQCFGAEGDWSSFKMLIK